MIRTFDIHPAAQSEAEAAARYYAKRNTLAALAFVAELDTAVAEIERAPHSFGEYIHGTRRLLFRSFPFSVVYRFDEKQILIVAIAHASRRPGYWAIRLSA